MSFSPGRRHELRVEIVEAIQSFDFANYGLDEVDPNAPFAEWVDALARVVVDKIEGV
jgi:hypothetical protein